MMRVATRSLAALAVAMLWISIVQSGAEAQQLRPTVVAVIDMKRIAQVAEATKDIRAQSEQYKEQLIAEAGQAEEQLRAESEELKRQRAILSPEAFAEKRREFDRKASDTQRYLVDRERGYKQSLDAARAQVFREIIKIVSELSEQMGYTMVVRRAQVEFFTPDTMEITDNVIAVLNQRLPSFKVAAPGGQ
ncbi:MAG: OmpH family outer membrane protein [Minwuiales bacterium]|nr:OmpH family outer membrane protein [Minwuiales bacterium]